MQAHGGKGVTDSAPRLVVLAQPRLVVDEGSFEPGAATARPEHIACLGELLVALGQYFKITHDAAAHLLGLIRELAKTLETSPFTGLQTVLHPHCRQIRVVGGFVEVIGYNGAGLAGPTR